MKRTVLISCIAVVFAFVTAIGLCFQALNAPQAVFSAADMGMKIVLDAGHGGIDGGVTGKTTGTKESDINLAITLKLKTELVGMGFDVTLTRKTEAGLYGTAAKGFKKRDMQKRKEIIQETQPALVISIHQNFYPTQVARGGQVFYNKLDKNSERLAKTFQTKLNELYAEEGAKARKAATGEYFMLQCCDAPSVIVECGFLSNEKDEKLLLNERWQTRFAQTLAAGVLAYLSQSVS